MVGPKLLFWEFLVRLGFHQLGREEKKRRKREPTFYLLSKRQGSENAFEDLKQIGHDPRGFSAVFQFVGPISGEKPRKA